MPDRPEPGPDDGERVDPEDMPLAPHAPEELQEPDQGERGGEDDDD